MLIPKDPIKILYYLGAGASVDVLPLAKSVYDSTIQDNGNAVGGDFPEPVPQIKGLIYELRNFLNKLQYKAWANKKEIEHIHQECKSLAKIAEDFGDIDTYAKYLHINKQRKQLENLKLRLSQYFSIKQLIDGKKIDKRYLPWLIGIMNEKSFPRNVKILSWNYDSQIQLTMQEFNDSEQLAFEGNTFVYEASILNCYPNLDPTPDYKNLSLIHLNGRAGFSNLNTRERDCVFNPLNHDRNDALIKFITQNDINSSLHFAWEGGTYHSDLMQHVKQMIQGVDIVVVIGYSFPFYNRAVDKEIFSSLKNHLTKIYYQDPILDGQQLKTQFNLDKNIEIVHIKQTDNFHIPFEY